MATTGKSTMSWFYGFKLHLIINERGEILNFVMTQAHVDDPVNRSRKGNFSKTSEENSMPIKDTSDRN